MIKTKIAAVMMAAAILAGSTASPVFANTDPAAEQADYTAETETTEKTDTEGAREEGPGEQIVRDTDASSEQTAAEEDHTPLTPAGNMTLVDNVTSSSGSKQFLTLTSRDGNFYYLIIDYDKDGNENVHFLNQVDERDLIGLM